MNEIEIRIARYAWDDLQEEQQQAVKQLSQQYAYDFGYDWEFEFFWLRFTPENWLLLNLHDQELISQFRRA